MQIQPISLRSNLSVLQAIVLDLVCFSGRPEQRDLSGLEKASVQKHARVPPTLSYGLKIRQYPPICAGPLFQLGKRTEGQCEVRFRRCEGTAWTEEIPRAILDRGTCLCLDRKDTRADSCVAKGHPENALQVCKEQRCITGNRGTINESACSRFVCGYVGICALGLCCAPPHLPVVFRSEMIYPMIPLSNHQTCICPLRTSAVAFGDSNALSAERLRGDGCQSVRVGYGSGKIIRNVWEKDLKKLASGRVVMFTALGEDCVDRSRRLSTHAIPLELSL